MPRIVVPPKLTGKHIRERPIPTTIRRSKSQYAPSDCRTVICRGRAQPEGHTIDPDESSIQNIKLVVEASARLIGADDLLCHARALPRMKPW